MLNMREQGQETWRPHPWNPSSGRCDDIPPGRTQGICRPPVGPSAGNTGMAGAPGVLPQSIHLQGAIAGSRAPRSCDLQLGVLLLTKHSLMLCLFFFHFYFIFIALFLKHRSKDFSHLLVCFSNTPHPQAAGIGPSRSQASGNSIRVSTWVAGATNAIRCYLLGYRLAGSWSCSGGRN